MIALTLLITKTAAKLSRGLGRGGGQALPGLLAERLDPQLAGKLAANLRHGVILVTGTNGKTTTTKLIAAALTAHGEKVLTNSTGSNLKRGITSALIGASDLQGRIKATVGLFEVDEASLRQVAPGIQPTHIVVLNLFRDQLDRYGELDTTAALIGQGVGATKAKLFLNADDPLVASLAKYASDPGNVSYFGVEGLPAGSANISNTAADSDRCPVCRSRLRFSRIFYGHIGHYQCPRRDFARPQPDVAVTRVESASLSGTEFEVSSHGRRLGLQISLPGTYNLYNALAAVALAQSLGVNRDELAGALARTGAAFGRVEQVEVEGRRLYLLLIKNPAGFTQVLETFLIGKSPVPVIVAINDLDADGRDVSWLWDVPLEAVAHPDLKVICTGIRATDMALRLKYAGVAAVVASEPEEAIRQLITSTPEGGTAYVLPTYTAMLQIRKLLSQRTQMQEVWR